MKTLLRIDASIRYAGSYSRTLGDNFVREWIRRNPPGNVIVRDVNQEPLPHLSDALANAFFAGDRRASQLELSNTLCDELKQATALLITCPMYNFGIPSTLKTWLDQVVRVDETFRRSNTGYEGLVTDKTAYVITSMGDLKTNAIVGARLEEYISGVLKFIGIADVRVLSIDGTARKCFTDEWQTCFEQPVAQLLQ